MGRGRDFGVQWLKATLLPLKAALGSHGPMTAETDKTLLEVAWVPSRHWGTTNVTVLTWRWIQETTTHYYYSVLCTQSHLGYAERLHDYYSVYW